jgi:hypothetical protein
VAPVRLSSPSCRCLRPSLSASCDATGTQGEGATMRRGSWWPEQRVDACHMSLPELLAPSTIHHASSSLHSGHRRRSLTQILVSSFWFTRFGAQEGAAAPARPWRRSKRCSRSGWGRWRRRSPARQRANSGGGASAPNPRGRRLGWQRRSDAPRRRCHHRRSEGGFCKNIGL